MIIYLRVADPEPGSGAFFDPKIRDEHPGSYFRAVSGIRDILVRIRIFSPENSMFCSNFDLKFFFAGIISVRSAHL